MPVSTQGDYLKNTSGGAYTDQKQGGTLLGNTTTGDVITKSAVAGVQATGTFHTEHSRSSAFTSGSWGAGFNGSQKKKSASSLFSAINAPIC